MLKILVLTLLLLTGTVQAHARQGECFGFLQMQLKPQSAFGEVESLRLLFEGHKPSSELTKDEKSLIRTKIKILKTIADRFNYQSNSLFQNHGTHFLPNLRQLFIKEETNFRTITQPIINELTRFLQDGANLLFRELDLRPHIRAAQNSWVLVYLDQPQKVFFNIDYFVQSRFLNDDLVDGYKFSVDKNDAMNAPVFINKSKSISFVDQDVSYPGSEVEIPRIDDLHVFPGLSINQKLISFLTEHGGPQGYLLVYAETHFKPKARNSFGIPLVSLPLPILEDRWSTRLGRHYTIKSIKYPDKLVISLMDLKQYKEIDGHLYIPTVPAVWEEKNKNIFAFSDEDVRTGLQATELKYADFAVAPTKYEFIVALIELLQL